MKKSRPKEDFKTKHSVFDEYTNRTIFKLISQGHFEGLESPISIGKESNVFSALKKDSSKVIVKIYRLETCDFNRMFEYIRDDSRFPYLKRGKRKIIFSWVQREYRNLIKARVANVSVPTPLTFSDNVLVLEFIGDDGNIAPKLKDAIPENPQEFFKKIILNVKKLYKAGFVHADLSAFNILNYDEKPVFIDFSQCTTLISSRSEEYLDRDIRNICNFFKKIGLKVDEKKVKQQIIGK
ncbi:serine/threonine protein kinase [Candidatus Woesearchaeota archaeon]|jgi:RIO kinase 1|nr:serine/threonine protein kinase [Candidatus Woesearchaeota archaeon]MDP6648483.1 serine protein kinase RIO [Candidatus Woesearchaeota archaeon]|tara:strand:+ start:2098 stop:2811 length:714 start_codon:yes stop_codon:yes gene_type:complete